MLYYASYSEQDASCVQHVRFLAARSRERNGNVVARPSFPKTTASSTIASLCNTLQAVLKQSPQLVKYDLFKYSA